MEPWNAGKHDSVRRLEKNRPAAPHSSYAQEENPDGNKDGAHGADAPAARRFSYAPVSRGPAGHRFGGRLGRVYRIRGPVLLAGAALLVTLSVLLTCLLNHLFSPRPKPEGPVFLNEALDVPVRTVLLTEGSAGRPGIKREIQYLVIHETANPGEGTGAKSHSNYLQAGGDGKGTSWHYTVDDHEIYRHVPDDEVAYHASSADGNTYGIGIELCVNEDGDFEKTFDNGARLAACLLKAYGLSANDLRQHGDFTEKNCPETIRNTGRWGEFTQKVKDYLKGLDK
ncbi:MAG: N-acetylmuramoyl-L-alanine amidase [Clostridiales bacterium]|nr:N-acetylmuramoyl-L-alanine amidase [Clostridiales bacterium]